MQGSTGEGGAVRGREGPERCLGSKARSATCQVCHLPALSPHLQNRPASESRDEGKRALRCLA